MKKILTLLFIVHCSLFITAPVLASYISLSTSLTSKVEGRALTVCVSTVNKGDEPACNVQAGLRVGGQELLLEKRTELPVNGSYQAQATLPLALKNPGTYPLLLVLHYTDANQYPFSALSAQTFSWQKEAAAPLFGQARPATFFKEGKLNFKLKNLGDQPVTAAVSLFAPGELTVTDAPATLTVPPKGKADGSFTITNFSALSGSTYQLFVIAEFDDHGLHYTAVLPGTVRIIEPKSYFGISQNVLIVILAALIVIFLGAQFIRR